VPPHRRSQAIALMFTGLTLANVLGVLKRHGINVQELDNTVFEGGRAACAKIRLASRPSDASLQEIMAFDGEVLHVDLVTLPNLA